MARPVVHFEIQSKDAAKAREFYSKVFDWKIDANNRMQYGMVEAGEGGIGGGIAPREDANMPGVTVYIDVPDLAATLAQVKAAGGRTIVEPTTIPGTVTFALFADPDGNVVGLTASEVPPA